MADRHTHTESEAEIKATIRIVKTKAMHEVDAVLHAEPQGDSSKGRTTHTHTHTQRGTYTHTVCVCVCVNEFINLKGLAGPCNNPRARTLSRPELALSLSLLLPIPLCFPICLSLPLGFPLLNNCDCCAEIKVK